ncbi:gamma-adaptin 1 [Actinidia rufa]|uniref:AP-1 complex subunit gamma n=1 Tax=Actinidia rufa TaxID=165716 RepID=A0A7J0FMY7_9ERIC|nr:gamma-adaptin 1 [Actinidia rufa]
MIRAIRACKTAAEERGVVREKSALQFVRQLVKMIKKMARDLAPEVERLLQFRDPNIRKKAALCSVRIIKKVPDLAENFTNPAASLLKEKHHGVLITGLQLCTDLCKASEEALEYFRKKCTEGVVKVLKDIANSPYAPEYDISGITDPFSSYQIAQVFAHIGYVALNMLMKAITVDTQAVQRHRVTILECVKDSDASIRKRALELVFLLVNDSNVKPLTKELIEYLEVSDQEFKGDLTAKICSIVEKFSTDKIWYIDQMLKVLSEAGNFVKDEVWHGLIVVISNASNLHGYTVRSLCKAVQTSGEQESLVRVAVWCIGEYAEMLVNNTGMLDVEEPITVTESDAVDVIEIAIKRHTLDLTTRAMCLSALLKLSSRFPACSQRIKDIIIQYKGSLVLELQQRSIEFNSIIEKYQNIRSLLVERMPVLDEATYNGRRAGSLPATTTASNGAALNLPNGVAKPAAVPLVDLLDLSSDVVPAPSPSGGDFLQDLLGVDLSPASSQSGTIQAQKIGTDVLLDLLSIGTPPAQSTSSTSDILSSIQDNKTSSGMLERLSSPSGLSAQASSPAGGSPIMDLLDGFAPNLATQEGNGPAYPSIVAFESSSLKLMFNFSKSPGNPQATTIQATFTNKSTNIFTDFIFQAAVPKFLQLHLDPASSNTLPASGNGSITQDLRVTNSQHGKKSLVMRIRISYKVNSKDVLEEGQINSFPRGL